VRRADGYASSARWLAVSSPFADVARAGGFPDVNYEQDIWLSTMALALCSGIELKHETVLYTCTPDNHCGEQIAKFQDPNYNDFEYLADNRDAAKRMGIPSYPAMSA
jgi:hypothetical protein